VAIAKPYYIIAQGGTLFGGDPPEVYVSFETVLKLVGDCLVATIAVVQFFPRALAYAPTRWIVAVMAAIAVICVGIEQVRGERKQKQERLDWENKQIERDHILVERFVAQVNKDESASPLLANDGAVEPVLAKGPEVTSDDPRIYASIKESAEFAITRTPFALTNSGRDVAHKVTIEMLLDLKGRSVAFNTVEVIKPGDTEESLPTVESEDVIHKHDIFFWMLVDWNNDSKGITEEWSKPITIRYEDFRGRQFEASMTLMFYPIKHMLKENKRFKVRDYKTWEFRDIQFKRMA
jgi:hypothetical protein